MSLTANEVKHFKLEASKKLATAKSPLEKLRFSCLARGASGITGLARQFKIIDDDGNKQLSKDEFIKGCKDFGVDLTTDEIEGLYNELDRDQSGSINFDEFLEALRVSYLKFVMRLVSNVW